MENELRGGLTMSTQMIICLAISLITVIGYLSNKLPMGVVAMLSLSAF